MKGRVNYLCLQVSREGQASHAHVHEIIKGLEKRGWDVHLFEPPIHSDDSSAVARLSGFIRAQVRLWFSRRADVLYVRGHFAAFPTTLLYRLWRIPIIYEVNGPFEELFIAWPGTRRFRQLFIALTRAQWKMADSIIVVTEQLREWVLSQIPHKRVLVIPNGANTCLFKPGRKPPGGLPPLYVVFFGALAAWQGIDIAVAATRDENWPEDVSLVVMGDGAKRSEVEAAQLSGRVKYLGTVPYGEIGSIVANSLASLCPMNNLRGRASTGLAPLKLFESLACGVPVIVTDLPGQADIVREHQCGIVVPPDDPSAIALAVRKLYQDRTLGQEMGRRGRKAAEENYSWDARAADTELEVDRLHRGIHE